ncbi:MAG: prepilin peptidase [Candidatus Nanopelagicales bacterium]|nr:prepilin peptidase [Candidatus Nanopelagicales bacterium]MDZ4249368.1 prepilin peptidase [Candidatus Nanopelagicales bacterium]
MTALLVSACGVLGLIVGSFLNVVIWRVPRGESVVSPGSACPACGHAIRAWDNIPVLSWLVLQGRCRDCGASISPRYPLVELGTGLLFAAMAWQFGFSWALPAFLYFAGIAVSLSLIDLDTKRLPNVIVLPSYAVAAALLLVPALAYGAWTQYLYALAGAVALFAFYFVLAWIYPAGMGFGDVKLAGVVGLYLGWLGWAPLIVGAFLGFLLGAVVGVILIAARRAGRKTGIPFGPFMLLGALIAVFAGDPLADVYLNLVGI